MNNKKVCIKVQDGCSQQCSYCIVRKLRGLSISKNYDEIYNEIQLLSTNFTFDEICICGVDLIEYNNDGKDIIDLLNKLLTDFPNITFSLDTINPFDTDKIIKVLKLVKDSPKLCDNFCIPIQSASDTILKLMHRPYTKEKIMKVFDYISDNNLNITTEVILGFPKETNEAFEETYQFLKHYKKDFVIHVFSPRPSTEAITMLEDKPTDMVIMERMEKYKQLKTELGY